MWNLPCMRRATARTKSRARERCAPEAEAHNVYAATVGQACPQDIEDPHSDRHYDCCVGGTPNWAVGKDLIPTAYEGKSFAQPRCRRIDLTLFTQHTRRTPTGRITRRLCISCSKGPLPPWRGGVQVIDHLSHY